jgi:hypothetical protein
MNTLLNYSKMSQLRGIQLPTPKFWTGPLSEELLRVNGYKTLQTFFPTLTKVFRLAKWNSTEEIWMDTHWRIQSIDCSGTSGPCTVNVKRNSDVSGAYIVQDAFLKVTHLLDPIQWIRGQYSLPKEAGLPWHHKGWLRAWQKLQDPGNQAYIDGVCSYAVGRLREEGISPHFNTFYGAFCARATKYRYNLTDEFQSYRHERWFWKGYKRHLFEFKVVNRLNPDMPISEEMMAEILHEYSDDDSDNSSGSESLEEIPLETQDIGSIHSDSMDDISLEDDSASSASDGSDSSEPDNTIYAEMCDYPVMLIITEKNEDTMDSLFENFSEVGAPSGTVEWHNRWTAWTFQVVAALCVAQRIIGFTHNDLHTNNIVWSRTNEEFLNYKTESGMRFKVPTYGKVFRIIDYGRAIFRINGQLFVSDDFKKGNDADGQYAFAAVGQKFTKEILPNPSFDLARLTVSMIDGIFPKKPAVKPAADVLSKEPGLTVLETVSDLYNLLWTWMIDDEGKNIFINSDGTERFPDFDLYKHIAEFIHGAVPAKQFFTPAFQAFRVETSVGKVYSLFC